MSVISSGPPFVAGSAPSDSGSLHFGDAVLEGACSTGYIPASLQGAVYDGSTLQPSNHGSIDTDANSCVLTVSNANIDATLATGVADEPAGPLILIADFVPPSDPNTETIVAARCVQEVCLRVGFYGNGDYWIRQGDTVLLQCSFNSDQCGVGPRLNVNSANRVIVSLSKTGATVWLNGRLLGGGPITLPNDPSAAAFTFYSGESNRSATEHLQLFEVYQGK